VSWLGGVLGRLDRRHLLLCCRGSWRGMGGRARLTWSGWRWLMGCAAASGELGPDEADGGVLVFGVGAEATGGAVIPVEVDDGLAAVGLEPGEVGAVGGLSGGEEGVPSAGGVGAGGEGGV
jgi:hypothetical protein